MDINTPKGQITVAQENRAMEILQQYYPNTQFIETDKSTPSKCDGFIAENNVIKALYEVKCRNLTIEQLDKYGTWLVQHQKIEGCRELSRILYIDFIGILYLVPEDKVGLMRIASNGKWCFNFDSYEVISQRSVNGGSIVRMNSYLPVNKFKDFLGDKNK